MAALLSFRLSAWLTLVTFAAVGVAPLGLSIRGRSSPLRWTRRLKTLAAVWAILMVAPVVVGAAYGFGPSMAAMVLVFTPHLMDVALLITRPIERRIGRKYVRQAQEKLERIRPVVVAVTGSYGKTSTKEYIRHLLSGDHQVVASPASFNNTQGLARAINEHLVPGTHVFVAEMGAYGPGEIAEMCSWIKPSIGVITAIGPVHLERFRTLERTAKSKAEILDGLETGVLNADEPLLKPIGAAFVERGGTLIRCSTKDPDAEVRVLSVDGGLEVRVGGEPIGTLEGRPGFPMNIACAVGVAMAMKTPPWLAAKLLATLPEVEHRQNVTTSPKGVVVIDDSYNSNPAGAAAALELLVRHSRAGGRRVVVTPGMVEMGKLQREANREFAAQAAKTATDIVIVGRTNRRALLEGAKGGNGDVRQFRTREDATTWARENLGPGDVILYENDLPDHYP
jgi:UDP-N-acetylmuramoyl-tripeptide--D-alanyl-D-alanine ligase